MKHLFKATKSGWGSKKEGVWFDSDYYSEDSAKAEFKQHRGLFRSSFEYDGQKYRDIEYLGEFEDDRMPHNDSELFDVIMERLSEYC